MKRRDFVKAGSMTLAATLLPGFSVAWGASNSNRKKVIYIFLRGGCDVLSVLPPVNSSALVSGHSFSALRPTMIVNNAEAVLAKLKGLKEIPDELVGLAASISGIKAKSVKDLLATYNKDIDAFRNSLTRLSSVEASHRRKVGGNYSFHPAMASLADAIHSEEVSFVLHTGSRHTTRSHFTQMDLIESGSAVKVETSGFISRLMAQNFPNRQAIALGQKSPYSLKGFDSTLIDSLEDIKGDLSQTNIVKPGLNRKERLAGFKSNVNISDEVIEASRNALNRSALAAEGLHDDLVPYNIAPTTMADEAVRMRLRLAGELAKSAAGSGLNPAMMTIDISGWDTHRGNQPNTYDVSVLGGKICVLMEELAHLRKSLKESGEFKNTMVVVMSEFGRTIGENMGGGTDHGRGSMMMVMGENLAVAHGASQWDMSTVDKGGGTLSSAALNVKLDYRDILFEVFKKHLGVSGSGVFAADYVPKPFRLIA